MATLRPDRCAGLSLGAIAQASPGITIDPQAGSGVATLVATGVSLDSRDVRPGDLYAALPGANTHGATFAGTAAGGGAVAVLTDPAGAGILAQAGNELPVLRCADPRAVLGAVSSSVYGHPADGLTIVGITGTNGKTTTAHLLDGVLRALGESTGLIGTIETRVAGERLSSVRTTPESPDLHGLLAVMRERGVGTCVMEVSSHALAQHRVDGVVFEVAAFTNLSQDHLDYHGTMQDYFAAKAALFTPERARRGVVVVDDEWGRRLARSVGIPVETLSSTPTVAADWRLDDLGTDLLRLHGPQGSVEVKIAMPGRHNRVNAGVAVAVLGALGRGPAEIERGFAALIGQPVIPGRLERVVLTGGPNAYVDYAHTPDAVIATLQALRPETPGMLVAVLGAGGGRDPGKREAMGAAAAGYADRVVVTDDNPRYEDPAAIRAAILAGARAVAADRVVEVPRRAEAIAVALGIAGAGPGGTVAVLGKGHEQGQDLAGVIHPFDDAEALRAVWRDAAGAS